MPRPNGYLLDTNILIALARNSDLGQSIDRTYQLTSGQYAFYLPVVVLGEAQAFAAKKGWGVAKQAALTHLLSLFTAVDINDTDVLAAYATIDAASSLAGTDMGKNDLWIAAIARVYDLTLLTTDKDFDHLHTAGIIDRTWVDPASKRP